MARVVAEAGGCATATKIEPSRPARGQVYGLKTPAGARPVVVVSNDLRNRSLGTVLVARITVAPKPSMASVVELPIGEPAIGRVVCDQIAEVPVETLRKPVGTLSRAAMRAIDEGLRVALGLSSI